jgi:hypothetical protein
MTIEQLSLMVHHQQEMTSRLQGLCDQMDRLAGERRLVKANLARTAGAIAQEMKARRIERLVCGSVVAEYVGPSPTADGPTVRFVKAIVVPTALPA